MLAALLLLGISIRLGERHHPPLTRLANQGCGRACEREKLLHIKIQPEALNRDFCTHQREEPALPFTLLMKHLFPVRCILHSLIENALFNLLLIHVVLPASVGTRK